MASIITDSKTFGKTEEFKRPTHPDFMNTKELQDIEFSGIRMNSITLDMEIWTAGDKRVCITASDLASDPKAVEKAWAELFCLGDENVLKEGA